jgi:hypothetical protein
MAYCLLREAHFPLTPTLSPIGERRKAGTDLRLYSGIGFQPVFLLPPLPPLRGERVGVRGAICDVSIFMKSCTKHVIGFS